MAEAVPQWHQDVDVDGDREQSAADRIEYRGRFTDVIRMSKPSCVWESTGREPGGRPWSPESGGQAGRNLPRCAGYGQG
ncbi:MAG: hypothetical protein ACLR0U_17185 [Enterocloster clostridioformis]